MRTQVIAGFLVLLLSGVASAGDRALPPGESDNMTASPGMQRTDPLTPADTSYPATSAQALLMNTGGTAVERPTPAPLVQQPAPYFNPLKLPDEKLKGEIDAALNRLHDGVPQLVDDFGNKRLTPEQARERFIQLAKTIHELRILNPKMPRPQLDAIDQDLEDAYMEIFMVLTRSPNGEVWVVTYWDIAGRTNEPRYLNYSYVDPKTDEKTEKTYVLVSNQTRKNGRKITVNGVDYYVRGEVDKKTDKNGRLVESWQITYDDAGNIKTRFAPFVPLT